MYQVTVDNILSDVSFQNNNLFDSFLVITETTEFGQVEESQYQIIRCRNRERKASSGSW